MSPSLAWSKSLQTKSTKTFFFQILKENAASLEEAAVLMQASSKNVLWPEESSQSPHVRKTRIFSRASFTESKPGTRARKSSMISSSFWKSSRRITSALKSFWDAPNCRSLLADASKSISHSKSLTLLMHAKPWSKPSSRSPKEISTFTRLSTTLPCLKTLTICRLTCWSQRNLPKMKEHHPRSWKRSPISTLTSPPRLNPIETPLHPRKSQPRYLSIDTSSPRLRSTSHPYEIIQTRFNWKQTQHIPSNYCWRHLTM